MPGSYSMLWTRDEVKDVFQNYGLWPSFIGVAIDMNKENKNGLMPVALTYEQNIYLQRKKASQVSRKRSRTLDVIIDDDNDEDHVSNKRMKTTFDSSSGSSFLSMVYSIFINPFMSLFRSHKPNHIDNEVDNINDDDIMAEAVDNNTAHKTFPFKENTFLSLKELGYFVGPGGNYGGDYTLYVGRSPADSHSSATVRIADDLAGKMALRDLVTLSRVQTQVNKIAIIAFPASLSNGSAVMSLSRIVSRINAPHHVSTDRQSSPNILPSSTDAKYLRVNFKDVSRRL